MNATDPISRFESLTDREKEVLQLFCQSIPYKEIGEQLFISENTVKTHVGNIYIKLGLTDLKPKKRAATIHEIYCPLLERRPPAPVVEEEEPEPIPPEVQQIVEEDESALILWEPAPIIGVEVQEIKSRRRFGCIRPLIWIIAVGGILVGLFFLFRDFIPGIGGPDTPTTQQVDGVDTVTDTPQGDVPSNTPNVETPTSPSPSATTAPSNTPLPTDTTIPSPTPVPDTPPGSILGVGDWWKEDGVWLRVKEYKIWESGTIGILVEFWNKTNSTISFQWNTTGNFSLSDNTGYSYPVEGWAYDNMASNEVVEPEEIRELLYQLHAYSIVYKDDYVFNPKVTELVLTATSVSRIDQAQFRIPLNK